VLWNHRSVVGRFVGAPDALVPLRLKALLERALARVEAGAAL